MPRKIGGIVGSLLVAACFFNPQTNVDDTGLPPGTAGPGTADDSTSSPPDPTTTFDPPTTGDSSGGSTCGNFLRESDEECDNGADNGGGNVCREDCTLNTCGDGYQATSIEGCDDGNLSPGDGCSAECQLEGCGDGEVSGAEECDDGDLDNTDECTILCTLPYCGDTFVSQGEQCDDGNSDNTDACTDTCVTTGCGDGFLNGDEECDDGNLVDDDACTNACAIPECGDGVAEGAEECDDGNAANDDACLDTCKQASCGDGFVAKGLETCDDAVPETMKVCSMCKRSAYYVFVSSVKFAGAELGDLAMADALCTSMAQDTAVAGAYKAWLSDDQTGAGARLEQSAVPYILANGDVVADDWADLVDGTLDTRINVTEQGTALNGLGENCGGVQAEEVWTGTAFDGKPAQDTCQSWTDPDPLGRVGLISQLDEGWTSHCSYPCSDSARVYCFEQP